MSNLSEKQLIYINIIELILPFARNVQTWSWIGRLFKIDLYPELELVHNIPPLLKEENFTKQDVYWLNTQGRNYLNFQNINMRVDGEEIECLIMRLQELIPNELKYEIIQEPLKPMKLE